MVSECFGWFQPAVLHVHYQIALKRNSKRIQKVLPCCQIPVNSFTPCWAISIPQTRSIRMKESDLATSCNRKYQKSVSRKSPQLIRTTLSCRKLTECSLPLEDLVNLGPGTSWNSLVLSDLKILKASEISKDSNWFKKIQTSWSIAEAGTVAGQPPKLSTDTFQPTRAPEGIEVSESIKLWSNFDETLIKLWSNLLADLVSAYLSFILSIALRCICYFNLFHTRLYCKCCICSCLMLWFNMVCPDHQRSIMCLQVQRPPLRFLAWLHVSEACFARRLFHRESDLGRFTSAYLNTTDHHGPPRKTLFTDAFKHWPVPSSQCRFSTIYFTEAASNSLDVRQLSIELVEIWRASKGSMYNCITIYEDKHEQLMSP